MAENANLAWYRTGTIKLTKNSTTVKGIGTRWATAGINQGSMLMLDNVQGLMLEIASVTSDTELELARAYTGSSLNNAKYSINRNFQSTLPAELAARIASLINTYEIIQEGNFATINGKSAYEIAVGNGFDGDEEQWLESLKAAGLETKINNVSERVDDFADSYEQRLAELEQTAGEIALDKLGIYLDNDGDIAQELREGGGSSGENPGTVGDVEISPDEDVDAMLDEIFKD